MNCDICNKWIKYPKNWIRHCNTKGHIKKSIHISQGTTEVPQKVPLSTTKRTQVPQKVPLSTTEVPQNLQNENIKSFCCKYCDKPFNHKNHMYRHMKHYCKEKQQGTTIINNTTNNNNTNNIVQNILNINVYGDEDFTKIMNSVTFELVKDLDGIELARKLIPIMYNTNPNNNIKITNMKQPYCLTLGEDREWIKKSVDPIIQEIINKLPLNVRRMFHQYFKQTRHEYETTTEWLKEKAKGNKLINDFKKMCKDDKIGKELKKVIKATLYNNNIK